MAGTAPVTGFSHVQLRVSDLAVSEQWYTTVLGLERLVADAAGGYVALRHQPSRIVVVLTEASGLARTGGHERLDHLAFAVPDGPSLQAWAAELTSRGIEHRGVVDELGKPSLSLLDPDGISVELVAPPAPR
jgi:catechol-2,3-dioxygenase